MTAVGRWGSRRSSMWSPHGPVRLPGRRGIGGPAAAEQVRQPDEERTETVLGAGVPVQLAEPVPPAGLRPVSRDHPAGLLVVNRPPDWRSQFFDEEELPAFRRRL